jgi:hypothetical protein
VPCYDFRGATCSSSISPVSSKKGLRCAPP